MPIITYGRVPSIGPLSDFDLLMCRYGAEDQREKAVKGQQQEEQEENGGKILMRTGCGVNSVNVRERKKGRDTPKRCKGR